MIKDINIIIPLRDEDVQAEITVRLINEELKDLKKKYQIEDLIKNDAIFVATGVTNGYLLNGIKKNKKKFTTHSLIITTKSKKIRFSK